MVSIHLLVECGICFQRASFTRAREAVRNSNDRSAWLANNLVKASAKLLTVIIRSYLSRQNIGRKMANNSVTGDGNVDALQDMNNMINERRGSRDGHPLRGPPPEPPLSTTSDLEPLDFQTSWSSKLTKYDLLNVITDIDGDVDSLTLTDTEDESSDVSMTPATRNDGGDWQSHGVTFAAPLVTAVHTIPHLTYEQIRILYYSRAERYFFKKQYRLEKMMARQDDPSLAYETVMGIVSNHRRRTNDEGRGKADGRTNDEEMTSIIDVEIDQ